MCVIFLCYDSPQALEMAVSGRITVEFVIGRDGAPGNISVLQSPSEPFSEEAVRVLKFSPKWEPGRQQGRSAPVRLILPLEFRLN